MMRCYYERNSFALLLSTLFKERILTYHMVSVNKTEKEAIKQKFPNAHIMRTVKQKSKRHKYYCEETSAVMKFLNELRAPDGHAT